MSDQTLRRLIGVMASLLVVIVAAGAFVVLSRGGSGGTATPPPGTSFTMSSGSPSATESTSKRERTTR